MRVRSVLIPLAALALAAVSVTSCAYSAVLPAAPGATDLPTTVATVTVPASWSVPVAPGATCANDGTQQVTFSDAQWNSYLIALATSLGLPNPAGATITGIHIEFPAGCYYTDDVVKLDHFHPLVDVAIDGGYTGDPALSPQIVQTNVPTCETGNPILGVANPGTDRLEISGMTITGSAPADMPYCGNGSAALGLGTYSGTGPHHITLRGNTLQNTWGDNLYIAQVDHLDVEGNTLRHAGRSSVSQVSGNDVTFTSNTMAWAAGATYQIETNLNSLPVSRVLVSDNHGSYANSDGTGSYQDNGLLWNVTAAAGTQISDVRFLDNTSDSALIIWVRAGTSGSSVGAIHRIAITGNTTTSNAGEMHLYNGDNLTVTNNKVLGGPPVALINGDGGYNWTQNPPRMLVAVPPLAASAVCGVSSGNSYTDATGATVQLSQLSNSGSATIPGYSMPACP